MHRKIIVGKNFHVHSFLILVQGPLVYHYDRSRKGMLENRNTYTLDEYKYKPALRIEVYEAIKQIYEELTNENFLTRCIDGYIQNNNESFNSTV